MQKNKDDDDGRGEVDDKYRKLAGHLLANVYIADSEEALQNSNGAVVLEKHGKYVKGKYFLAGGSVGLFEGKKIGRVKNLEKLIKQIASQEKVEAFRMIEKYVSNPDPELREWSILALQESRMVLQSGLEPHKHCGPRKALA